MSKGIKVKNKNNGAKFYFKKLTNTTANKMISLTIRTRMWPKWYNHSKCAAQKLSRTRDVSAFSCEYEHFPSTSFLKSFLLLFSTSIHLVGTCVHMCILVFSTPKRERKSCSGEPEMDQRQFRRHLWRIANIKNWQITAILTAGSSLRALVSLSTSMCTTAKFDAGLVRRIRADQSSTSNFNNKSDNISIIQSYLVLFVLTSPSEFE